MSTVQNYNNCVYCMKECKSSDSKPYPNSRSKEKIHHKCQIKKNLKDRNRTKSYQKTLDTSNKVEAVKDIPHDKTSSSIGIFDRLTKEDQDMKNAESRRVQTKLNESLKSSAPSKSIFFDLEAGVAKPHEKRRYLHHRNITEIVSRYNDECHHEEAIGRAFDHTGKDLNLLDHESDEEAIEQKRDDSTGDRDYKLSLKRKYNEEGKIEKRRLPMKIDEKNPCWFCLSSPKVEKHLIVAIGDYCYVTLAKGGLSDDHLLILPIDHIQCLNDPEANSNDLIDELEKFKKSFVNYFKNNNQGVVFFERNFKSVHWQLQVVPIDLEKIDTVEENIKSISRTHFDNSDYIDIPKNLILSDVIPAKSPYLFWQVEPIAKRFVTKIEVKGSFFPIQLGRLILADESILNCPDRIDWKSCIKNQEDYEELNKITKIKYKDYDFT